MLNKTKIESNPSVGRDAYLSLRGRKSRGTRDRNGTISPPVTEEFKFRE